MMRSLKLSTPNKILLLLLCPMYFILFVDRVNLGTVAPLPASDIPFVDEPEISAAGAAGISEPRSA